MVAALTDRARNGVKVRLTVDAMGSFSTPKRYFKELRNAKGAMEFYHPLRWNTWMRSNYRTHRELLVIDGNTAFIGGAGIADHWLKRVKKDPQWRDEMFRVRGDAVRGLQGAYLENWLESSGELLAGEQYFPKQPQVGNATCLVVTSTPSRGGSTRARVLFQALLAGAKKSIQVTTPYFLPDKSLRDELINAKQRGVNVRVMVPGAKSDHLMTRSSSRRVYGPLLQAGVEIHEYQPSMLHAKILVVDGVWSVLGSTNFDNRSFGLNDEINLAVLDPQLANYLTEEFNGDVQKANTVTYEQWKKRPLWERAVEPFGALLERQQ
jgi:cardiolipin synthase